MNTCFICSQEYIRNPQLTTRIEKSPQQGMGLDYSIRLSPGNIARIKLTKKTAHKYHIDWVYVPSEFRGSGLGESLLKKVLKDADRSGITLTLDAKACGESTHQNKLEAWYAKHKFAKKRSVRIGRDLARRMERAPKKIAARNPDTEDLTKEDTDKSSDKDHKKEVKKEIVRKKRFIETLIDIVFKAITGRRNPEITLVGKKVLADNQTLLEAWAKIIKENILLVPLPAFFFGKGAYIMWFFRSPTGRQRYLEILDDPEAKETVPIFPVRLPVGFGPGSLERFWKVKTSKLLVGAIQFSVTDDQIVITHMSVKPKYRRNRVNSFMIDEIKKTFPDKGLFFHELTKQGRAFMKKYGGQEF